MVQRKNRNGRWLRDVHHIRESEVNGKHTTDLGFLLKRPDRLQLSVLEPDYTIADTTPIIPHSVSWYHYS